MLQLQLQLLSEGITDLEDLDVRAFISAVSRIGQMEASERLDGSGIQFGLDDEGKLYTSRLGKNSQRFYSEQEYPYLAKFNGYRGAHAALETKEDEIKSILSPGEAVQASVIFGRQPNSTTYGLDGKNFIAIIAGLNGVNDLKINELLNNLKGKEIKARSVIVDTTDGVNLDRKVTSYSYQFIDQQKIKDDLIKEVNVKKELKKLEKYLDNESGINNLTNFELMSISLGSIPKEERDTAKAKKEEVISIVKNQFKIPIKKEILDKFVSKVKPALTAADATADEDNGISGVVFKDPESGEILGISDKNESSTLNAFNYAVQNEISGTVKTADDAAPLAARGGIAGQMQIRIADLLGNKDLALTRSAKELFANNQGETPTVTLRNVAKLLSGNQDFNGTKNKIDSVIGFTLNELQNMLDKFLKHKDDPENTYRLRLKNGRAIGLSPEIVKRTLTAFAETRRNLFELQTNVKDTKTFDQLISALYGKIAREIHRENSGITESLNEEALLETKRTTDTNLYLEIPSAWHLVNTYLATVMMATVMYKANDQKGIWLLRDKHNYRMAKFDVHMNAVNFWGYPVWKAKTVAASKMLSKSIVKDLTRWTSKVPHAWVNFLHLDLSYAHDVPIDWDDHLKTLKYLIQHSDNVNTERVNNLLSDAFNYEKATFDENVKFLPKLYFFAMQFVPSSPLLTRIRAIQHKLLGTGADTNEPSNVVMAKGQKLLGEDGEIAAGPAAIPVANAPSSSTANGTSSNLIAQVQTGIGKKRQIVRRKRNPDIVFNRFERPKQGA